jgi:hypothetical protein
MPDSNKQSDEEVDAIIRVIEAADHDYHTAPWRNLNPKFMMIVLSKQMNKDNKPIIPKSYTNWTAMNISQRRKVWRVFASLSEGM